MADPPDTTGPDDPDNPDPGRIDDLAVAILRRLNVGGEAGTTAAVDLRLARIETDMLHVRHDVQRLDDRVRGVEVGLARLDERVSHLPSKGFIVTAVISALAAVAAISAFVQWVLKVT